MVQGYDADTCTCRETWRNREEKAFCIVTRHEMCNLYLAIDEIVTKRHLMRTQSVKRPSGISQRECVRLLSSESRPGAYAAPAPIQREPHRRLPCGARKSASVGGKTRGELVGISTVRRHHF